MLDAVQRLAAFTVDGQGGNPAGVALLPSVEDAAMMQRIAKEVGYSETVFAAATETGHRVRYFAPQSEVPFCGHATIALGAVLGAAHGAGAYPLTLNDADITVEAFGDDAGGWRAALQSPRTHSAPMSEDLLSRLSEAFSLGASDIGAYLPAGVAFAGARHAILPLASRALVAAMAYEFDTVRQIMAEDGVTTVMLVWPQSETLFHARNAFAIGGVYEDPATGAAAAAFAGYLRDRKWAALTADPTRIEIIQGEDMGRKSRLLVDIPLQPGASIRVSGATQSLAP